MNLAKHVELQRALQDAASVIVRPPLTLAGVSAPLSAAQIADSNLNIVRNQNSGCIQFIFPQRLAPQLIGSIAGARNWLVHAALRAGEQLSQNMIELVERHNKPERLLKLGQGWQQAASPADLAASRGRKVLLLVHGIFSSCEGAFAELASDDTLAQLLQQYQGQVYGYDHWTIAKTPQQNALDLLSLLPPDAGWQLDILCHSRGGLVVRSLLVDSHSEPQLAAIGSARKGRIASVGQVVFVAAANQGTPLAQSEDLQNFLNVAVMLASISGALALDLVILLARVVLARTRHQADVHARTLAVTHRRIVSRRRMGVWNTRES